MNKFQFIDNLIQAVFSVERNIGGLAVDSTHFVATAFLSDALSSPCLHVK
ncbi:hypothetical protein IAE19_13920 [Acinetobacter sp. S40]|nr:MULTISPECIES: hypothetical protein [unclassified Acinetobacter]MBJ9986528.1 hypothetical protein [Acinetobacter sp. S40]MBK0064767.1 hypothetical protein [Acinetobacter sp. S55]MBK0068130.1 hypothetical protein [Acinetobacter sp. S54]